MITIINYGTGNIKSVANMLRKIGHDSKITNDPVMVEKAEKIILPGIGAFDTGMKQLKRSGLFNVLNKRVLDDRVPILGICLGMQLFAKSSEEGRSAGLGWINADVIRFNFSQLEYPLKIPHMGWNYVNISNKHSLFVNAHELMRFYFVHSFHYICYDKSLVLATARYGYDFVCGVVQDNIMGVQFHPEKSHKYGMCLLKNFVEMC